MTNTFENFQQYYYSNKLKGNNDLHYCHGFKDYIIIVVVTAIIIVVVVFIKLRNLHETSES